MKHIEIIIPTRNRLEKLKNTLNSIPEEEFVSITVVCDNDFVTRDYLCKNPRRNVTVKLIPVHVGSVYCRNLQTPFVKDGVICAMDNVIFNPGALQKAMSVFNEYFPDNDGVFGFSFETRGSCTSLVLIGQKFLQRYPNKQLFYPGYFHFACQEISSLCGLLEKKYNKRFLVIDESCLVVRIIYKDETYREARKFRESDLQLKEERESKGLVWGWN